MARSPPSVEGRTPMSFAGGHDDRIRRNVACINCRNSKVRCKASLVQGQPCQRCAKLQISCVVDKSHKRVTKRSKLEQLEQELRNLKQVVHPKANGDATWSPPSPRLTIPSIQEQPSQQQGTPSSGLRSGTTRQVPTPLPDPPLSAASSSRASERPIKSSPTQPHVLGDHVLTGDEIDWYFDKYLQHFHPFLPILRKKDPDECFDCSPTLFWVVIFAAARRYCTNQGFFNDLTEHVQKELVTCVSNPAMGVEGIHAALIICAWPLPTIRFVTDPSTGFAGMAANASILSGFHSGRGSHPQFCFASRGHISATDEEASSTHLATCFISQCCHAASGLPPPSISVNEVECKKNLTSNEWADLVVLFDIQKFLNRFYKYIYAQLSTYGGIPDAVVREWEDEFEQVKPHFLRQRSDIVYVMLLAGRLQIQQYYFCGVDSNSPNMRMHTHRVFNTCRTYMDVIVELESRNKFLSHAPQWVFRSVLDASAIILYVLHCTFGPEMPPEEANAIAQQAYGTVMRFSARSTDMPHRWGVVMETFWTARHLIPRMEGTLKSWPDRLGAGVVFSCARSFKETLQEARKSNENINKKMEFIRKSLLGVAGNSWRGTASTSSNTTTNNANGATANGSSSRGCPGKRNTRFTRRAAEASQPPPDGTDRGLANGPETNGNGSAQQPLQQPVDPMATTLPAGPGVDPFQDVDWSMFMDDFGWAGDDTVFLGLP